MQDILKLLSLQNDDNLSTLIKNSVLDIYNSRTTQDLILEDSTLEAIALKVFDIIKTGYNKFEVIYDLELAFFIAPFFG